MMNPEAFAEEVARRASMALSKRDTRGEIFAIGDVPFQLVAPDESADQWLGRAFLSESGDPVHAASSVSHRLAAWDGTAPDSLPPPPPWTATAPEPLGVVGSHSNAAVRCAIDTHTNSLLVYNFDRNSSYTWYPSIAELPAWAKASPFRVILSWLCNLHGMQIVHGAAVAIGGRAVLLAGEGGSGKSTTALACALAGMDYLGDDYCAVQPSGGKVHMVYRTAKLFPSTLEMLPSLASLLDNPDRINVEKGVIFLRPDDVSLVRSAELSAIILPRVGVESSTVLSPATRAEVVKAILPSTIGGLMGGTSTTPRLLMELVRSVPAFHLSLGTSLTAVIDKIASRLN